jgi:hypothetical protein
MKALGITVLVFSVLFWILVWVLLQPWISGVKDSLQNHNEEILLLNK